MRRRDCVRNLDTPSVCAKRHRQMTIKCAYSNVELQCSVLRAHCTRASRELVDGISHPETEELISKIGSHHILQEASEL